VYYQYFPSSYLYKAVSIFVFLVKTHVQKNKKANPKLTSTGVNDAHR